MTINISSETGAQLETRAQAEGLPIGAYIERLMFKAESRRKQLAEFFSKPLMSVSVRSTRVRA